MKSGGLIGEIRQNRMREGLQISEQVKFALARTMHHFCIQWEKAAHKKLLKKPVLPPSPPLIHH